MLLHTRAADIGLRTDDQHARDRAHEPAGLAPDRLRGPAQQGDRRAQRLRARVGHPPGRRAQGAHDLRDHGRHERRPGRQLARARQALRPPRAAPGAREPRHRGRGAGAEHRLQALQGDRRPQEDGHARWTSRRSSPTSCATEIAGYTLESYSSSRPAPSASRTRRSSCARPSGESAARRVQRRRLGRLGVRGDQRRHAASRRACASSASTPSPRARTRSARSRSCSCAAAQSASGQGVATDIVEAAARAYLRALTTLARARGPGGARPRPRAGPVAAALPLAPRDSHAVAVRDNVRLYGAAGGPRALRRDRRRAARARAARGDGPLAARAGAALRRQLGDALAGRARRDQPDAARRRAHRGRPRSAPLAAAAPRRERLGDDRARRRARAPAATRGAATARGADRRRSPASALELSRAHARAGRRHRRRRRPADARARQPRDRRSSRRARSSLRCDGAPLRARGRRLRDLRRRPAPPLREPTDPARRACWRSSPPGCAAARRTQRPECQRRCSTRSGRPTRSRPACSTSTCTSSTRSRARRPSRACASPGAACAGPTARSRPPTTTCRPTARRAPRRSATSSRACRSQTLERNCAEFGIPLYSMGSDAPGDRARDRPRARASPSPGMTIVCGDSHTATHGAFGALAFGIGTSEVEHVLATQCMVQQQAALDADPLRGRARLRRHREGPDPRDDRPDRRRRRRRPRRRVQRARRSRRSRWRAA